MHRFFAIVVIALAVAAPVFAVDAQTPARPGGTEASSAEAINQAILNAQLQALDKDLYALSEAATHRLDGQDKKIEILERKLSAQSEQLTESREIGTLAIGLLALLALCIGVIAYLCAVHRAGKRAQAKLVSEHNEFHREIEALRALMVPAIDPPHANAASAAAEDHLPFAVTPLPDVIDTGTIVEETIQPDPFPYTAGDNTASPAGEPAVTEIQQAEPFFADTVPFVITPPDETPTPPETPECFKALAEPEVEVLPGPVAPEQYEHPQVPEMPQGPDELEDLEELGLRDPESFDNPKDLEDPEELEDLEISEESDDLQLPEYSEERDTGETKPKMPVETSAAVAFADADDTDEEQTSVEEAQEPQAGWENAQTLAKVFYPEEAEEKQRTFSDTVQELISLRKQQPAKENATNSGDVRAFVPLEKLVEFPPLMESMETPIESGRAANEPGAVVRSKEIRFVIDDMDNPLSASSSTEEAAILLGQKTFVSGVAADERLAASAALAAAWLQEQSDAHLRNGTDETAHDDTVPDTANADLTPEPEIISASVSVTDDADQDAFEYMGQSIFEQSAHTPEFPPPEPEPEPKPEAVIDVDMFEDAFDIALETAETQTDATVGVDLGTRPSAADEIWDVSEAGILTDDIVLPTSADLEFVFERVEPDPTSASDGLIVEEAAVSLIEEDADATAETEPSPLTLESPMLGLEFEALPADTKTSADAPWIATAADAPTEPDAETTDACWPPAFANVSADPDPDIIPADILGETLEYAEETGTGTTHPTLDDMPHPEAGTTESGQETGAPSSGYVHLNHLADIVGPVPLPQSEETLTTPSVPSVRETETETESMTVPVHDDTGTPDTTKAEIVLMDMPPESTLVDNDDVGQSHDTDSVDADETLRLDEHEEDSDAPEFEPSFVSENPEPALEESEKDEVTITPQSPVRRMPGRPDNELAEYAQEYHEPPQPPDNLPGNDATTDTSEGTDPMQLLSTQAAALAREGRHQEAINTYGTLIDRFGHDAAPRVRSQVLDAMFHRALSASHLGRNEDALRMYRSVTEQCANHRAPEIRNIMARSIFNEGVTAGKLGDPRQEIAAYQQLIERFGQDTDPQIRKTVAKAFINRGIAQRQINDAGLAEQTRNALETHDKVIREHAENSLPEARAQVAEALLSKGITLDEMGQPEAAIACFQKLIEQSGQSRESEIREIMAKAILYKGALLGRIGQPEAAVSSFQALVDQFGRDWKPAIREQVAAALFNQGVALGQLGRLHKAAAAFQQLIDRFGQESGATMREQVAMAMLNLGTVQARMDEPDDAIASFQALIDQFDGDEDPIVRERVAKAFFNKATALNQADRLEDSIDTYQMLIDEFGRDTATKTRKLLTDSHLAIGLLQILLGKRDWTHSALRHACLGRAVTSLEKATGNHAEQRPASAYGGIGYALFLLDRTDEAELLIHECRRIAEDAESTLAPLREILARYRIEPEDTAFEQLLAS